MSQPIRGATFDDLADFLRRPVEDDYTVDAVRECICASCNGRTFEVEVAYEDQGARRTCLDCGDRAYIGDSEEYWDDDAEARVVCECPCGGGQFAAAVGYSMLDDGDVRWIFVGLRCLGCGQLGVYEDWKIDYGPSGHLVDQA
jgi:hypothetical protein